MMSQLSDKLPAKVLRFDLHMRLQHFLMALSVLMLIITGFPIKYGHTQWAKYVINLFGGFGNMFNVHKTFAVIMILSALYHVFWLAGSYLKGRKSWAMMPQWKDFVDCVHHIGYLLGLRSQPPNFGRYTYLEKFEYFAVVWGVIVMGLSGAMLWFPQLFIPWLPRWAIGVARVVHSNEAFVCMLAIFIGHFFAVHFNPKVFPSSRVWLDGYIDIKHLAEEHPLEYKQMLAEKGLVDVAVTGENHHRTKGFANCLPLQVFQLVVYTGLFILLLWTFVPMLFA